VVAFALGLIAVGYYVDRIAPRNDTVFTVGDRKFSYAYLEDRVDAANAEGRFVTSDIVFGIARIVADIQNEELVRLIAAEEGVTATQEEIEQQMREDVGASPEAERNVFAARLRDRLQTLGLSLDRYEEMMEAELLEQKLTDRITESLPAEMEQVDASIIQVETDAQAVLARERLAAGDAFEDVAKELSRHSSAADGGALGW